MTPNEDNGSPRTSQTAYDRIKGQFAEKHAWNSALDNLTNNAAVQAGWDFLLQRSSLQGKLVIYGFSAGGFNALRLCDRMRDAAAEMRGRQVDLLITVDPCLQLLPAHASFETRAPRPLVGKHVNYYQLDPRPGEFRGRIMLGANLNDLKTPLRLPGGRTPHDQMPTLTLPDVQGEIGLIIPPAKALHVRR